MILRILSIRLVLAAACALVGSAIAQDRPQPSFDCAKAGTTIEQMICGDGVLANWDAEMGQLYRQALKIQNNSRTLIDDQRISVAYLEANPQRLHENFIELTIEALRKAWPCKQ